jgi:hypothetical protein
MNTGFRHLIKGGILVCLSLLAGILIMINANILSFSVIIVCLFFAWLPLFSPNNKEKTNKDDRLFSLGTALAVTLFIILIIGVLFSTYQSSTSGSVIIFGFVKVQPLTPSIAYRNTSFTAAFTNALSTAINLTGITMNETISDLQCNSVKSSPDVLSLVKAGGTFTVTGVCPQKADGDSYDLVVTIRYNATMGGITTNHTDTGHIKGRGEPC